MKRKMRGSRLILAIAVVLLAAAGCGGGGGGGQGSGGGGQGGGNNLVVGYQEEPKILNGYIVGGDLLATADMISGILESPLQIQPDLSYAPELTDGDPKVVSEDPLVIEYKLREGLKWSDGKPLTSADAKFTYEQIMNPDNQIITRIGWEKVEKFETPDERTVRLSFSEPYAPWRDMLVDEILPKHVYEGKDFNKALNNEVVGSGPFKLREWRKGESFVVERNENYWGEKAPLDSVTFRFIPDSNSLITALTSGEVDFINPPPDIGLQERLEGIEGAKVLSEVGTQWEHLAFNTEKVNNLKLRQAIAYGIDREQIVNEVLKGQVEPLQSVLMPEQGKYYAPAWEEYTFDQGKARQLVEEAKAEGAATKIVYTTTTGDKLRETLQQVVQKQLGDIGLEVEIRNASAETFYGEWTPAGDYELGEWNWFTSPDPQVTTLFSANQIPPKGQNYYRYGNEEVAELLERSDVTANEEERAELLTRAQEIMAEDVPLIPLYQVPYVYAHDEAISGPEVNPTLAGAFWNIGKWSLQR
ncbi:MAG: hypothetical protein CYG60_16015 [Actinobacteria bacterium]|nr:MAG: hypothetical protein CYG60_16015 [Actinomycetota bacterium]